jgi:hypothetical protein
VNTRRDNLTSHPPIPPSPSSLSSLPVCSNSKDFEEWFSYWEADRVWSKASKSWRINLPTPTGVTKTDTIINILESIQTLGEGTPYTACDGVPRFRFNSGSQDLRTTKQRVTAMTTYEWIYTGSYRSTVYPETSPTKPTHCEVTVETCIDLRKKHEAAPDINKEPGCPHPGRCVLEAIDEVALIYWLPDHPRDICAVIPNGTSVVPSTYPVVTGQPTIVTTNAITFRGQDKYYLTRQDTWPLLDDYYKDHRQDQKASDILPYNRSTPEYITQSVLYGDFTFTYPTVYLAHRPVWILNHFYPIANIFFRLRYRLKRWYLYTPKLQILTLRLQ